MNIEKIDINEYGFADFKDEYNIALQDTENIELVVARIIEVQRDRYKIVCELGEFWSVISGKFRYTFEDKEHYPVIGDWVLVQIVQNGDAHLIQSVLDRKTCLSRQATNTSFQNQIIAANVDKAFIITSLNDNFNLNRIERYINLVYNSGATPIVLLSKCDLVKQDELNSYLQQVESIAFGLSVIAFSCVDDTGINAIKNELKQCSTYILLGSSGVGKSTLINKLLDEEVQKVNDIRYDDSKGKHTTTSRKLFKIHNGSLLIDVPGIRAVGVSDIVYSDSVNESDAFSKIEQLIQNCRFYDCTHTNEPGCAVISAIADGEISEEEYERFLKQQKINKFYDAKSNNTAHQQRLEIKQKNKMLSKHIKAVTKTLPKR